MLFVVFVIIAYLLGCISPSIIQGRMHGFDIRTKGSGNAGTTNTLRVLGKKAAVITLCGDILKGVIAVRLGMTVSPVCGCVCALAAFCGHIWPCFYGFKGGKGVAAAFGTVLAVNWKLALICLACVAIVTVISKMMSAGSLTGAVVLPVLSFFMAKEFFPEALIMGIIIIIKHRANIQRILKGEESKLKL